MNKRPLFISIALILGTSTIALTGCGDSSSDANPNTPTDAFSKMVNSEILFNPTVNGDDDQARQYLNSKLGTSGSLTSAQAAALNTSFANANAVDSEHPYKATAAVVNKVVTSNAYDVTVTTEEIAAQKLVKKDLQLNTNTLTWEESDHDEDPRGMVLLDGRNLAVIATDEHNSLVIVDTSNVSSPQLKSQKLFAGVEGPRYTIDAVTGASEHGLREIIAAPDGQSVYISVRPDDGDDSVGNAQDDRYGLFRVAISNDGVSADYNDASSKRYVSAYVGAIHITPDGKVYMEDTDADVIRVLDADLNDTGTTLTLPAGIEVAETFFTTDHTVYVATKGDDDVSPPISAQLHKVDGQTGAINASMDIDTSPDGLVLFDNGNQALIYEQHLYAAILDLTTMQETRRLPLSETLDQVIQTATVTPDGHYAILAGHHKSEIWIFDLTIPVSRMEKLVSTDTVIRALAADANGGIFAAGRDGFVDISELIIGDVLTPQQAVTSDLAFITEESLNHGLPLSVVVADLSLYPQVPAGAGSDVTWSTDTGSINITEAIDHPLGSVTRPTGADESGNLTATLAYQFRDISETGNKNFTASIRQAPGEITQQGDILNSGVFPNGFAQAIGASPDGTRAVAGFREEGGFNVIKRGAGNAPEYALNTVVDGDSISSQAFPDVYHGQRPVGVRFLDNNRVLIALPEGENTQGDSTDGALLIYGVDDTSIAGGTAPLQSTLVVDGKIQSISHMVNGKIAVVVDKDGGRNAVIFDAATSSMVGTEIMLSATANEVALSDDSLSVFVIESGGISKYSGTSGTPQAQVAESDDFGPYIITMSAGIVYVGTDDGKLFRFNATDLSSVGDAFVTGYGGRTRVIDVVDGKVYMSIWGFGLTVIDPAQEKELAFFDNGRVYRSGVSGDGSYIFAFVYIERSEEGIRILKLPE